MSKKIHFDYSYRLLELGFDDVEVDEEGKLFCNGGFGGNLVDIFMEKSVQSKFKSEVTCKRCLKLLGTREFSHIDVRTSLKAPLYKG